jgi:transcriptional regulator with XRE-family HTH domain
MKFLKTIRDLRKARGWTQSKLAEVSGLHQGDISKIEAGKANVEAMTLETLSSALDAEFVLVPRRALGAVRGVINEHLNHDHQSPSRVTSVRDDLFIPDGSDDDDDKNYGTPRL